MTVDPWLELEARLPEAQRRQLAELIIQRLDLGWGELIVIFKDFHLKGFTNSIYIQAVKPDNIDRVS